MKRSSSKPSLNQSLDVFHSLLLKSGVDAENLALISFILLMIFRHRSTYPSRAPSRLNMDRAKKTPFLTRNRRYKEDDRALTVRLMTYIISVFLLVLCKHITHYVMCLQRSLQVFVLVWFYFFHQQIFVLVRPQCSTSGNWTKRQTSTHTMIAYCFSMMKMEARNLKCLYELAEE